LPPNFESLIANGQEFYNAARKEVNKVSQAQKQIAQSIAQRIYEKEDSKLLSIPQRVRHSQDYETYLTETNNHPDLWARAKAKEGYGGVRNWWTKPVGDFKDLKPFEQASTNMKKASLTSQQWQDLQTALRGYAPGYDFELPARSKRYMNFLDGMDTERQEEKVRKQESKTPSNKDIINRIIRGGAIPTEFGPDMRMDDEGNVYDKDGVFITRIPPKE